MGCPIHPLLFSFTTASVQVTSNSGALFLFLMICLYRVAREIFLKTQVRSGYSPGQDSSMAPISCRIKSKPLALTSCPALCSSTATPHDFCSPRMFVFAADLLKNSSAVLHMDGNTLNVDSSEKPSHQSPPSHSLPHQPFKFCIPSMSDNLLFISLICLSPP